MPAILQYSFLYPAIALCLLLAGIFSYFGYHVVRRGVIFVDLALAQMAALGMSMALALGYPEDSQAAYAVSLAFTLIGALLFSVYRKGNRVVPIEALIGVTYAGAMTLSLLLMEKSAQGTEHIREMFMGAILTVSWRTVINLAVVAVGMGLLHVIFRRRFLLLTEEPAEAERRGIKMLLWDLLFYGSFGVLVNAAVRAAGVLPVFAFLTIPAVASAFAVCGAVKRMLVGWGFGIAGCLIGLELSMRYDTAAGSAVVGTLLLLLLGSIVVSFIQGRITRGKVNNR